MRIVGDVAAMRAERERRQGRSCGLVPTMGYLHEGHLSLVRASRAENDLTTVSIFVNPTQFAPGEDLARYPRDFESDSRLLEEESVDLLFAPKPTAMYPPGFRTEVEVARLSKKLCGRSRPTHFRGVTTVVLKLFQIAAPDRAYFGQKDAQQAIIIRRMCRDLNLPIDLRVLPIIRDADGLALSSRNVYLSPTERQTALALPRSLATARKEVAEGEKDCRRLRRRLRERLEATPGLEVDYIATARLDNLEPQAKVDPVNTLVACAVRVGATRLIDNFILGEI